MSAKIQVNIRLTPDEHARLLAWAGEAGIERGALAHDIVVEGLDARSEGRATFSRETPGPGDLVALAARLDKAVMEVERFANAWAAHEAELLSQERKDRLAMHSARSEFLAGFPERISGSLNPIRAEVAALRDAMIEAIANQPRLDAIDRKQVELADAVQRNSEAIQVIAKEPRKVFGIILGDGRLWSTAFLCQFGLLLTACGTMITMTLGAMFPAMGIPLVHKLVAGDAEFCRLVRYRFETDSCQVPASHRVDPARTSDKGPRTKSGATSMKAKRA